MTADLSSETLGMDNPFAIKVATPIELEKPQLENDPTKPRYLTQDEILASSVKDFGIDSHAGYQGAIERASIDAFIKERVTGVRMNGVDVLSIDFEHSDEVPDPYIEKFIRSDKTKLVVAEYFYPELQQNLARSPLPNAENIANAIENSKGQRHRIWAKNC